MLARLAMLMTLVASSALAADEAEIALQVMQSTEATQGLPRMLQLAHADMVFCGDSAAAQELQANEAERTTVRAKALRLASQAGLNLVPGLIEGTLSAFEHATIKGYQNAVERAALTGSARARFCEAAQIRREEARQFRSKYGPTAAAEVRTLSSEAREIEDFSRRLLAVYIDQNNGEPLKTVARKPAELEHCGAPEAKLTAAQGTRDRELAALKNIFREEIQAAEPSWPHGWLAAAQVHLMFAYVNSYSTGVINALQALDEKEREDVCKRVIKGS